MLLVGLAGAIAADVKVAVLDELWMCTKAVSDIVDLKQLFDFRLPGGINDAADGRFAHRALFVGQKQIRRARFVNAVNREVDAQLGPGTYCMVRQRGLGAADDSRGREWHSLREAVGGLRVRGGVFGTGSGQLTTEKE